jgi:hypothetical protein
MAFMMICPWCDAEKKPRPRVSSWQEVLKHLKKHKATKKQIAQAEEAFRHEMQMHNNPYEAYAGCSEWEALGVSPDDEFQRD